MEEMEFLKWSDIKYTTHLQIHLPICHPGDIWWIKLGKNIGSEPIGKGDLFLRPVVILKVFSKETVWCIPITTKSKHGTWFYSFEFKSLPRTAKLIDLRSISTKRLHDKIGELPEEIFLELKQALNKLIT